jgi:(4-(4-[2-(gamma-L-glutamylamino)ethyl]phenoxymethyl)furan-2-yl)methanamine synthase
MQHVIGLDIGGANIKAAHSDGPCRSRTFPIWQSPDQLVSQLRQLVGDWLPCGGIALTMTAELADCFATKREGVEFIVNAVNELADTTPVAVWQTSGEFTAPDVATEFPMLTAAANWHALATFVGRLIPDGTALLIDVGSTTTDIIPLEDGLPVSTGLTDRDRLMSGELVYSGVRRTPLCAIAHSVPLGESYCPLAAELFATTRDVYLLAGDVAENVNDYETANGGPATREAAHDRVARMLCCDREEVTAEQTQSIAAFLAGVQQQRIRGAVDRVLNKMSDRCSAVLLSGEGSFIAQRIAMSHSGLCDLPHHQLSELFSTDASSAACAFAVARLANEQQPFFLPFE